MGPEGLKAFFTELRTAFPDMQVEVKKLVADGDSVAFAYTLTGTHQGDFNGYKPPGRPSRSAACRSAASSTARWSSGGARPTSSAS